MSRRKKRNNSKNLVIFSIIIIFTSIFAIGQFGLVGTIIANLYRLLVGETYPFLALVLVGLGLYTIFTNKMPRFITERWIGASLVYVAILVFLHFLRYHQIMRPGINIVGATWNSFTGDLMNNTVNTNLGGGLIGAILYAISFTLLSSFGTFLLIATLIFVGIMTFGQFSYMDLLDRLRQIARSTYNWISSQLNHKQSKKKSKAINRKTKKKDKKNNQKEKPASEQTSLDLQSQEAPDTNQAEQLMAEESQLNINPSLDQAMDHQDEPYVPAYYQQQEQHNEQPTNQPQEDGTDDGELDQVVFYNNDEDENYKLPPIDLLNKVQAKDQSGEYSHIERNKKVLDETFANFGVDARVVNANLGPAVTKYEIQPGKGVKVNKVVSLADDIALALAAKDIRMEAPIPGKNLIGLEVPNAEVSMVSFREVVEASYKSRQKLLEVPLGKNISGQIELADLSKMPHLLIAGATGSGKSVGINTIITSLLLKAKPNEVKLMMIDPKMVELSIYNEIPHMLTPVVTKPKKAAQALNKVVQEMERRYELFAASGTRNMAGYNEFVKKKNETTDESYQSLPYIVVIVDELADLMMVASKDVEAAITRLAQMARAAGIHMILATQRPSVDVITGTIKANVPSRIAFAVSSGTDSRTILDSNGAEKLLGRGDMLFLPMGANKPSRVQGAYITDEEVQAVVDFVTDQQEANYVEEMIPDDKPNQAAEEPDDELYAEAVQLVVDMQTASASYLQRRFRIGYNRAARLIDDMEARGVVGPSEGSKPREVLVQAQDDDQEPGPVGENIENNE